MKLKFPQLLSLLLFGLGVALLISAIRPAATYLGAVLLGVGVLGVLASLLGQGGSRG